MTTSIFKVSVVQAAPVFLNLQVGLDKAIGLIAEAGGQGAKLIAFPETWLRAIHGGYGSERRPGACNFWRATTPTRCEPTARKWPGCARRPRNTTSTC